MVELVYTTDLKSVALWAWGFESPFSYQTGLTTTSLYSKMVLNIIRKIYYEF